MIRIITDSAADFTREEQQQYNLTVIPLQITFGTDAYEDGVTLMPEIFWTRIMSGENPKTSQPSPEAFLSAFEAAKAAGDSVVCVLLSSGLSGTVQSATLAKDMADYDDIHIIDSLQAATAQKMLVLRACQLRDEGILSAGFCVDKMYRIFRRADIVNIPIHSEGFEIRYEIHIHKNIACLHLKEFNAIMRGGVF